jgi:hypothetical protein
MATVSHINPMPWDGGVSQPGVLGASDLTLARDSATQVTIAAGSCYVALSSGLLQRVVMPSSTVLASIPPASASNFRLDQVVVNIAGVSLLAGTQGTGVTIANRQGAAVLDPGTDQLHDLLVSSSGVAAGAASIRDRRGWARGVAARYLSTTASLASVPTTGIELVASRMRLECSGSAMLAFTRGLGSLTSGLGARVGVWVDGALHPALSGGGCQRRAWLQLLAGGHRTRLAPFQPRLLQRLGDWLAEHQRQLDRPDRADLARGPGDRQQRSGVMRKIVSDSGPGVLMSMQRLAGTNEGYVATGPSGTTVKRDAGGTALSLSYFTPVATWVRVTLNVGLISCDSAAYNYLTAGIRCTPADQDGVSAGAQYNTQHSAVNRYGFRGVTRTFRCAAATAYTFDGLFTFDGGTWTYYQGVGALWIELIAWAQ